VAARFHGAAPDGYASLTAEGKPVGQPELLRELAAAGWQAGESLVAGEKCWVETGLIDHHGHKLQDRLADQIPTMLQEIAALARRLALAGRHVRIVTDHGWLLMPGDLPVAKIGTGLTESKWSRCAVVKDGSAPMAQQLPWSWNASVMVATAPGAHVFWANDYAHGGISLQESVVPELLIAPMQTARKALIVQLEWAGMRVRVRADGGDGVFADLRLGTEGEGASIGGAPRPLDAEGRTALVVADDTLEGQAALLVLRDAGGGLVASKATKVGG
jgi:hypothetical protein